MTGFVVAERTVRESETRSAQTVWEALVKAAALGLGHDGCHFEQSLKPVILNSFDDFTQRPVGCFHQGPGRAPVIFAPKIKTAADCLDLVEALGSAIVQVIQPWTSPPVPARSDLLLDVIREGLKRMRTPDAHWLLEVLPSSNNSAHLIARPMSWPMISGFMRASDLEPLPCSATVHSDGTVTDGHGTADMSKLAQLGEQAIIGLSRNALAEKPLDFTAEFENLGSYGYLNTFDFRAALGAAIIMLSRSPYHRQFRLSDYLPVEIIPAIRSRQVRIYFDEEGKTLAFVSWARVSPDCLDELQRSGRALRSNEWQSGPKLFFNDWISAGTPMRPILSDIKRYFPDTRASSLRRTQNRDVRKVNTWSQAAGAGDPEQQGAKI